MKIKCYLLSAVTEEVGSMPVYYKMIGTDGQIDDYCSELWAMGEDAEIDTIREATEKELEDYALREEYNWPLVYESIRHFE